MNLKKTILPACVAFTGLLGMAQPAAAASVYLSPATQTVPNSFSGMIEFDLFMDFAPEETTLGGGIDIRTSAGLSVSGFVESSYFTAVMDPGLSGYGTAEADHDFEIHFGEFVDGLSGVNRLGTLYFDIPAPLATTETVELLLNSTYGSFYSASSFTEQSVSLVGATVSPVPEPASAAMMLAGIGLMLGLRKKWV